MTCFILKCFKTMDANQSNTINSLAQAINWVSSSIWSSKYPEMQDSTILNLDRALQCIADAEAGLKEMKELMSK